MSPRGAVHNALSRGPLPSALTRAVGDSVGSSGLERYGETLTPVLNLWGQPEWAYLRHELLISRYTSVGGVAAELGAVALVNPAGSGWLAVLEAVTFWTVAGSIASLNVVTEAGAAATLAVAGRGVTRDSRSITLPGVCLVYNGTDAGTVGTIIERSGQVTGLVGSFMAPPMIISPGQAVVIQAGTVNITFDVHLKWRERVAFPGELE